MRLSGKQAIMRFLGYTGSSHHTWRHVRQRFAGAIRIDPVNGRAWALIVDLNKLQASAAPTDSLPTGRPVLRAEVVVALDVLGPKRSGSG